MRRITTTLLAALAIAGQDYTVGPRSATWEELRTQLFDTTWIVPRASAAELERSPRGTVDLVDALKALAELHFEPSEGETRLARARNLGDLLRPFAERRYDPEQVEEMLARLERDRAEVWARIAWALPELVRESRFLSERWDPDEDRRDDGFLAVAPRDLEAAKLEPFGSAGGSKQLVQVATVMHADLVAAKSAENDFRTWPARKGASYEFIRPIRGSYLRGDTLDGKPCAGLRVEFRADLPFPFSHYDCDLRMLHRLDQDGFLVSDVLSKGGDFYWLSGHDLYIPVLDSEGRWVCMLCVRVFGTDLRGVPDGAGHLEAGARPGVGGLKRDAERLWRTGTPREPVVRGVVPAFVVHGRE